MKLPRYISRILSAIFLLSLLLTTPEAKAEFPQQLNGTMMPYDFTHTDTIVPWHEDMTPVFVAYVARHGARYLSSEKKVERLKSVLEEAGKSSNLSLSGKEFLDLIESVDSATAGNWGALNATGIYEEQRLAREMTAAVPGLLKMGRISAQATYVPRVVMTMYELCHGLAQYSSDLQISTSEGRSFNKTLRFFNTNPEYVSYLDDGPWKKYYEEFVTVNCPVAPAIKLFLKAPDEKQAQQLTMDMYGILQSLPAARLPWNPEKWFNLADYRRCWRISNLKHYLQRSTNRFSSLPMESASPLLMAMVDAVDSVMTGQSKKNGEVARMWFGHAETVMPLFSLMDLPGCYLPSVAEDDVAQYWKDWEVSPLGANLMIVILQDRSKNFHAALRLNGKWVKMLGSNIIDWDLLRSFWLKRCHGATKI